MLGAEPMKLGSDLRGGVHFLMEVDMDTALSKLQEQTMDTLRSELREKGIPYASIRKLDNNGVEVRFRDDAARDQAISYIGPRQRDLVLSANGANTMKASLTDARLSEAREYAVQQNITILRNRVNQLGVAEPLVQRRAPTASWSSYRAFRTPRVPKKFWAPPRPGIPSGEHQCGRHCGGQRPRAG